MITSFAPFTDGFFETGNQVHDWVMQKARHHFEEDRIRRRKVCDPTTFAAYRDERRTRFLASLGGLPKGGTSLATIETGRVAKPGYEIRKLIYQSLPGVYVTALLYVPGRSVAPAPAVLMTCGHNPDGKAGAAYQRVCIDLVRAGFVVLIIDSPSHGEMVQCLRPGTTESVAGLNTREHSFLQLGASVLGQNIARYFLWNAMRGIDLLSELPEVDPERIGATGSSVGGTLTQYLMMADPRVKAAMPCCSVTSREFYLSTGVRAYDGEQNLFGAISSGIDYADLLASFAPRPLRIGAAEHDFFGIEGVEGAVNEARVIYRALGAEHLLDLCVARHESHGYSLPLRRGCVDWFSRHLIGRARPPFDDEPSAEALSTLQCTRSGQVQVEFANARSILDLTRADWELRRGVRKTVTTQALAKVLGDEPPAPVHERRTKCVETVCGTAEHVFFFTEPGIITTAVVYTPAMDPVSAVLLLIPGGTEGQRAFAAEIERRVEAREVVMVFDVRGTGAVQMRRRNHAEGLAFRSTEYRVANDHFLLGTSLAARRAYDVRCALKYLRGRGDVGEDLPLNVAGYGWPAIYGVLAACTEPGLASSLFEGLPISWAAAFETPAPQPDEIAEALILPSLAGIFDIADLSRLAAHGSGRASAKTTRVTTSRRRGRTASR